MNNIMKKENTNETSVEVLPEKISSDEIARDLDADYEYTRDNLKVIIEKGSKALDGILDLARESDHPRAYEVVGQIIKNVADVNRQLIDLQKDIKGLKNTDSGGPKTVTNALFVGSTHELQKLLKGKLDLSKE